MTTETRVRPGQPDGWNERDVSSLDGITLPDGAKFYDTPGHGFLRVDLREHTAKVSSYDYRDGPHHVLLEEDCSMTMWLAEKGLIPMEDYILDMMQRISRIPAV
uniref:Uncharacterized protein n=1 Tax=viral metagenome TaxID=1070528 RepID=A0A6M3L877_9ZZZZ